MTRLPPDAQLKAHRLAVLSSIHRHAETLVARQRVIAAEAERIGDDLRDVLDAIRALESSLLEEGRA